jgi:anti-sigma B factor antagonist
VTQNERALTFSRSHEPGGPVVLHVTGEVDHHTAPLLRGALAEIADISDGGVLVDLSGLRYCDSTGITVLVTAHHRAVAAGSAFGITGLHPDLARVFEIVGIDRVIPLHPTAADPLSGPRRDRPSGDL